MHFFILVLFRAMFWTFQANFIKKNLIQHCFLKIHIGFLGVCFIIFLIGRPILTQNLFLHFFRHPLLLHHKFRKSFISIYEIRKIDRFLCLRYLNDHINLPNKIESFAAETTNPLVAKNWNNIFSMHSRFNLRFYGI